MTTLKMHSPNLVDDNIAKIATLFPNCITEKPKTDEQGNPVKDKDGNFILETAIDFDQLKQELSHHLIEGSQERYRLDWVGKREAILTANSPIAKTLRPCRDESVNFDTTSNLFIEGDNLEALKLLQESYLGAVKMIYIDPPYNTGDDFIYNDDFSEDTESFFARSGQTDEDGNRLIANTESNGRFHSDWLSMMYSRLKLARNLLSDDGVIFISIDDNEVHNLRKICDEIFGSQNFIECYVWESTFRPDNSSPINRKNAESILCYSRDKALIKKLNGHLKGSDGLPSLTKNSMNEVVLNFRAGTVDFLIADGIYVSGLKDSGYELLNDVIVKNGTNSNEFSLKGRMTWGQSNLDTETANGTRIVIKTLGFVPYVKKLEVNNMSPNTIIPNEVVGDVLEGRATLSTLFNLPVFSYPKPISLIEYLANYFEENDFIIMDFFAGSASTAHAIINLNAKDGGNRKFILIQLPEVLNPSLAKSARARVTIQNAIDFCTKNNLPTTIAEISKERIRRAGAKIKTDNADKAGIDGLDVGFRVLKIDSTNMADVYYRPQEISQDLLKRTENNIKADRTDEDVLFQFMLDTGVALSLPIERLDINGHTVYAVGGNSLVAAMDYVDITMIDEIAKLSPVRFITSERAIATDSDKTNLKERLKQLCPHTTVKFI